jgi:16S rRNA (cytidine1402-2'-O)-methyltransferase
MAEKNNFEDEDLSFKAKKQEVAAKFGELFVVSVPIGNNDDITIRAMHVLKFCDIVLCENFKEGKRILHSLKLDKDVEQLNEQNESFKIIEVMEWLKEGQKIALISDAGTPVFADPGFELVKACLKQKVQVSVIPGVSCIMTALVRSGFSLSQFTYAGFLSREAHDRHTELKELAKLRNTVVMLETPYRMMQILEACAEVMPNRNAYLALNLTMPFESHIYGTFREIFNKMSEQKIKAEFVICFEGAGSAEPAFVERPGQERFGKNQAERFSSDRRDTARREFDRPRERFSSRRDDDRRSGGDRGYSDRRPGSDRPRDFKAREDRPRFDRDERPREDRKFGDKPRFERSSSDRPRDERPREDRGFGDRRFSDRRPGSDRLSSDRPRDFKPREDRPRDERPREDRGFGDRDRRSSDRKPSDRKWDDKGPGERRFSDRRPGSDRASGENKTFVHRVGDRDSRPSREDRPKKDFSDKKAIADRPRKKASEGKVVRKRR